MMSALGSPIGGNLMLVGASSLSLFRVVLGSLLPVSCLCRFLLHILGCSFLGGNLRLFGVARRLLAILTLFASHGCGVCDRGGIEICRGVRLLPSVMGCFCAGTKVARLLTAWG